MNRKLASVLLIIVLILVNTGYFIYNQNETCDKCSINFVQTSRSGVPLEKEDFIRFNFTANELYNSLINKQCVLEWDSVNGYIKR